MITATILGRLQTKILTYLILALVTLPFAWIGGEAYLSLLALAMVVGVVLETLWGLLLWYQPGWFAFIFGAIEFLGIALLANFFSVPITLPAALIYYTVSWLTIQLFLIYIVPVFRMCWGENGGEIW